MNFYFFLFFPQPSLFTVALAKVEASALFLNQLLQAFLYREVQETGYVVQPGTNKLLMKDRLEAADIFPHSASQDSE